MAKVSGLLRPFTSLVLALFCVTSVQAGPYSALYGFGDSLSDVGNDLIITTAAYGGTPPQVPDPSIYTGGGVTGRFTNGAIYLDGLASSLGLGPLAPSLAGGTVYAYGGARTTYEGVGLPAFASFDKQIAAYSANLASAGTTADANALYVLWIGANDMADAIGAAAVSAASGVGSPVGIVGAAISNAMTSVGNAIAQLASLGAQHFLIPNLPDLSLTPLINVNNSPLLDQLAQFASIGFNQNLAATLDLGIFSALDIRELDIYALLNDVVTGSPGNGFTNVADSCYTGEVDGSPRPGGATPTICNDPTNYVFWDYEHPTAAVHAILAERAYVAVIPEPPAMWLLVFTLAGLTTFVRRRQVGSLTQGQGQGQAQA